jgi:hypothetical protein
VKIVTYGLGPEQYAPPHRRPGEPEPKTDQVLKNAVDGNVRRLVPRDVPAPNPQREVDVDDDRSAESLNVLVQRIAGSSMDEIDRAISELEAVREVLRNEGERVSREIAGYASMSHSARTVVKIIGDSIKQWRDFRNAPRGS